MTIRNVFFPLLFVLTITVHCGLFEPELGPGSLQIILVKQEGESDLEKVAETLASVQCTVKKGSETKFDGNLTKQGSSFHGEVDGLEPGSDYSVLLYGKNSNGEIIARGYQSGINVNAGKSTTVTMSWISFKPVPSSPANGSTTNNNLPTFNWSSVSNASSYELIVDNNVNFTSPEIDQTNLTGAGYTAANSLSDETYYWKVRCRDNLGNWGGWSEVWSFTIQKDKVATPTFNPLPGTYTTSQNVTISCSTSGATIHYTTNGIDPTDSDLSVSSGSAITISGTTTLKSRASKSGWSPSDVVSGTYIITLTDIDGNIYKIVTIGVQVWMAENLKVIRYRNGDAIPNITDETAWSSLTTGAYCNYNNNSSHVAVYGRLYNWYAVNDNRNIAPAGWHVPNDAEWQILVDYLGGDATAGGKMKETGTDHWSSYNIGATNESGFSALPSGFRVDYGEYGYLWHYAFFWSSVENVTDYAWNRELSYNNSGVYRGSYNKRFALSVRCIKD